MAEYIERESFISKLMKVYCNNCDRRKGVKNGRERFVYDIGDAPCRSCGIDDMINDLENTQSADVQPVVHCQDCTHWEPGYIDERDNFVPPRCVAFDAPVHFNDYCSWGVKRDG